MDWTDAAALATIAGISRQKAHRAIKLAKAGKRWRGAALQVRTVAGRGGPGGLRTEVLVSSLPADLQARWREARAADLGALIYRDDAAANGWRAFWTHTLAPVLAHPKRSAERAEAIRAVASRAHFTPEAESRFFDERTIRAWVGRFEAAGVAGLQKRARRDRGRRRVLISARWDKATAALDPAERYDVAEELRAYVRGLVKAGESGVSLEALASRKLAELTGPIGYAGGAIRAVCRVPRAFIAPELIYRQVHEYRTDRKAYMDRRAPRISRSRAGLAPMDIIVGDVHPVDILVRRHDGSVATFRAIAWLDVATNRLWADLVLLGKGEGIRNAHVIASFRRMTAAWGLPRSLYLDNGGEYGWAEFVDDALKLIDRTNGVRLIGEIAEARLSQVIRALPYNASAKPIEGVFGLLEAGHFSRIPGWIGGDRTRKKSANVGRDPEPFPGTADDCRVLIQAALDYYHHMPQSGALKGRSPNAALADAIAAGWGMTAVDADAFAVAFSTEEERFVRQGVIRHGGGLWTCPEIVALQDDRVVIRAPKYEDWSRLPVFTRDGRLLGFAEREAGYGFLETEGAREAHRRRKAHAAAVVALGRSAPDIDPLAERALFVAEVGPAPVAPVVATVGASEEAKRLAAGLRETPREKAARRQQEIDDNQREMLRLAEKRRRLANGRA